MLNLHFIVILTFPENIKLLDNIQIWGGCFCLSFLSQKEQRQNFSDTMSTKGIRIRLPKCHFFLRLIAAERTTMWLLKIDFISSKNWKRNSRNFCIFLFLLNIYCHFPPHFLSGFFFLLFSFLSELMTII